jgi:hypothetical protein
MNHAPLTQDVSGVSLASPVMTYAEKLVTSLADSMVIGLGR